jgi:hypothetical protein
VALDPTNDFAYVTNYDDSTVSAYRILAWTKGLMDFEWM